MSTIKKEHVLAISIVVLIYFCVCGGLCSLAYWGEFSVNFFAYTSLPGVWTAIGYPATLVFFLVYLLFIPMVIYLKILDYLFHVRRGHKSEQIESKKKMPKLLLLVAVIFLAVLLYSIYLDRNKIILIFPLLMLFATSWFVRKHKDIFVKYININESNKRIAVVIAIVLPFYSYGFGYYSANVIKSMKSYSYVVTSSVCCDSNIDIDGDTYVGRIDDYVFFLNRNTKNIVIVQSAKIYAMELAHYSDFESDLMSLLKKLKRT